MSKLHSWIVIFVIGLFPLAYAAHTQEQDFWIVGTVVNGLSGVPLAKAEVFIVGTNGLRIEAGVLTDARGRFGFDHVVPGKYLLSARAQGYPQQTFQQHENFSTAIAVGVGLDSENILFRLLPTASLEGQVLDEFSEPIRVAQVMLFQEGISDGSESVRMQTQITTDDQGRYRFGRLQPGRYYVAVMAQPWYAQYTTVQPVREAAYAAGSLSALGEQNTSLDVVYPVTYYFGAIDPAKASTITLQPGDRATADFTLQPVPALHLRLTAPLTDFSQNVGVQIRQPTFGGHEVWLPAQRTGNNKEFIDLGGIPPGHVIVGLDSPLDPERKERRSWRQDIEANRDTTVNITEVTSTVAVSGIVKNTGTNGLPQAAGIGIRDQKSGSNFFARVSTDGKFEFQNPGVQPGKYDLAILNAPVFFVVHVAAIGAKVSGRSIEIASGQPVQLAVEVATGMGRVEGVALRDGKPAGGIMIMLVPEDFENESTPLRRDQSDSDGTFLLTAVPGRYTLVAVENGWDKEWANPSVMKIWLKAGEPVEVAPEGKYTVKVKVQ